SNRVSRETCYRLALRAYNAVVRMLHGEVEEGLNLPLSRLRAALADLAPGARHELGVARATVSDNAPASKRIASLHSLTNREIEVLKCIAEGDSTKQVAWRLRISVKTAACHRYHVMDKLAIHDTATLVHYAIRNGMIRA